MSVKNGINGWAGSVLRVNLTTGAITTEDTLPKYKPYIGGMGLGYKVIWDEVPLDSDPLGPAAKAVFAIGPLTASGVPCSDRMNVSFLSCWSKGYSIVDAHMGGHIAHAMKYAGYDAIIKPVLEGFFGEGCVDKPKAYTPINENKIKLTRWAFNGKQWHDSATLCNWMYPMTIATSKKRGYVGDLDLDAKYMSAVVGEDYTREGLEFDSERISQLLRVMTAVSFKLNLGSTNLRQDHDQPSDWVFDKDPDFKPFEEYTVKLDREDFAKALDMWYDAMGWSRETGIPTRETLEKFDLGDCADKLEELGLI